MTLSLVEVFGYCASALIAYSLTRSSILKLRWFNLFGSSSFCIYGIIIGAFPVALLNGFIAMTNVFFLRRILLHVEDNFAVLSVRRPSNYVDFFLDYHQKEINELFPRFLRRSHDQHREYFFLTEGTDVVGVVSGYRTADEGFIIDFDFVVPAYRDFRLGRFVIGEGREMVNKFHFAYLGAKADSVEHERYLQTLGFVPGPRGIWALPSDSDAANKGA
ncbi:hypothetical protein LJ739_00015 [Aestuariibacter halophilus]|uniref:N-acetyltransferase domain-containing protein n=1 Tax=Fluctibacter halophilus TaxID=226011 RepID=A0ABS8G209_9ALTE|nr:hypothetical protein [Aestuariibacter halophilus]MCC2614624.1 hypothetical protein [Aestuariibacter halophilus]